MTVADIAFLTSYASIAECGMVNVSEFPELPAWLERVKKEVPNYAKVNGEGAAMYGMQFKNKMKEIGA